MNTAIKMLIIIIILACAWIYFHSQDASINIEPYPNVWKREKTDLEKISLSEGEWKEKLSPEQYYILRESGTEPAFSGKLLNNKKKGTYLCAACYLPLFSSVDKYDSYTGWPSFTQPIDPLHIILNEQYILWIKQVEVACARCNSHLGHVFNDGPPPTGQRYCINSLALQFEK